MKKYLLPVLYISTALTLNVPKSFSAYDPSFSLGANDPEFTYTGFTQNKTRGEKFALSSTTPIYWPNRDNWAKHSLIKPLYDSINLNLDSKELSQVRPLTELPSKLHDVRDIIHAQILKHAVLRSNPKNKYYVGKQGELNPKGFQFDHNKGLATKITLASLCYGIEPFILAGIIQRESKFKQSVTSATGAAGLTQLTDDAILEFLEQHGKTSGTIVSKEDSSGTVRHIKTDYYPPGAPEAQMKMLTCYYNSQKDFKTDSTKKWTYFEHEALTPGQYDNKHRKKNNRRSISKKFKKWASKDPDRYIVVGAMYLRTMRSVHGGYVTGVTQYNGAAEKEKANYKKAVIKRYKEMKNNYIQLLETRAPKVAELSPGITEGHLWPYIEKQHSKGVYFQGVSSNILSFSLSDKKCSIDRNTLGRIQLNRWYGLQEYFMEQLNSDSPEAINDKTRNTIIESSICRQTSYEV